MRRKKPLTDTEIKRLRSLFLNLHSAVLALKGERNFSGKLFTPELELVQQSAWEKPGQLLSRAHRKLAEVAKLAMRSNRALRKLSARYESFMTERITTTQQLNLIPELTTEKVKNQDFTKAHRKYYRGEGYPV